MSLRDDSRLNKLEEQMAYVLKAIDELKTPVVPQLGKIPDDDMTRWLIEKELRKTLKKNG